MSEDLSNKKCIPCEGGIPAFTIEQINDFLKKVNDWNVSEDEKNKFYLIKEFSFKTFVASQMFDNKGGDIAEKEGHHPDISQGWGYAKMQIYTNALQGLAERDVIRAYQVANIATENCRK